MPVNPVPATSTAEALNLEILRELKAIRAENARDRVINSLPTATLDVHSSTNQLGMILATILLPRPMHRTILVIPDRLPPMSPVIREVVLITTDPDVEL